MKHHGVNAMSPQAMLKAPESLYSDIKSFWWTSTSWIAGHGSFLWATTGTPLFDFCCCLPWVSKPGWIQSFASFVTCAILSSTSGAIPVILLTVRIAAEPFWSTYFFKHQWGSNQYHRHSKLQMLFLISKSPNGKLSISSTTLHFVCYSLWTWRTAGPFLFVMRTMPSRYLQERYVQREL